MSSRVEFAVLMKKMWNILPSCYKRPFYFIKAYLKRGKVIYKVKTPYSSLQVIDKKGYRYLVFVDPKKPLFLQQPENIYQSIMDLNNPLSTSKTYADYCHLAWIFNPQLKTILMIGLGGGTVPKRFLHDYPEIYFKTVEIDSEVVRVAYDYFFLPRESRHEVIIGDGRNYLKKTKKSFDLILLDAFFSYTIPHHLFTKEFFEEARKRLSKNGLLGININGALTGPNSTLFRSIYKTMDSIFPKLYLFSAKKDSPQNMQNIFVFALTENLNLSPEQIYDRARRLAQNKVKIAKYPLYARNIDHKSINLSDVPILSDAFPPPGREISLSAKDMPGKVG